MKKMEMSLRDLLISKLNVLYDVETNLVKAIPKLAKAASDPDLKKGLLNHLEETRNHVIRLEKAHEILEEKPKKLKSEAIRGLIKDSEWVVENIEPETAKDANIVQATQYVEHYEMAGYMGAVAWAKEIGETEIADILQETLAEEVKSDKDLATLGEMLDAKV